MTDRPGTDAFLTLYHSHVNKIYAYLMVRCGHAQTAEDLTSQVWMKAWQAWPTVRPERPTSWVYQIARRTLIDHQRHQPEIAWDGLEAAMNRPGHNSSQDIAEIRQALWKLADEQRDIIVMRVWDGLSFAEIAEVLNSSESACKMRYQRGVVRLGSLLTLLTLFLYAQS